MVSITFQPTTEDTILFVGGGKVAERRMQLFIDEPCNIVVIAPTVTDRATLKCYFEGKRELFKGLAIDKLEKDWKQYPVFHLSFGGQNFVESYEIGRASCRERV